MCIITIELMNVFIEFNLRPNSDYPQIYRFLKQRTITFYIEAQIKQRQYAV